ncbi:integral peroxisomal membrane protein [Grosmannia clavigera kw1407]|uniref:Integral peroxisomal membrane protein n=1 Tax=Grosmannia clavigera (strain kw1407 / UAMH 11150) TaxID=655863 RepID=F0XSR4_GROCL|nr:integral peroxisomal membrane protein [Grosmannia clavigera kw1407]EFW99151.1 integral peroxisomal membrane protein [Grosmannia clavigera kw1407]
MEELTYMFLGSPSIEGELEPEAASPASRHGAQSSHEGNHRRSASAADASPASATRHARSPSRPPETPKKRRGIRGFLSRANLQDPLLDKLFQQVIPIDNLNGDEAADADGQQPGTDDAGAPEDVGDDLDDIDGGSPAKKPRPGFSVAIMSANFRRFNARIGVVFRFQKRVERLLAWRRASHTLALLGVYSLVCLNPYLLTMLPPAIFLLAVLIPAFVARHPGGTSGPSAPSSQSAAAANTPDYTPYARGPPLAPPRTVKPVKELSRDFFRNMGDLQNSMEDFSVAHDQVVQLVVPATNFSDEAFSSALFVALCAAASLLSVAAHLLPWRLLFLSGGWLAVGSGHPAVARALRLWSRKTRSDNGTGNAATSTATTTTNTTNTKDATISTPTSTPISTTASLWNAWVAADIILDEPPEAREVEIFELQRRSAAAAAEWEPWLFSPSPYDPLSQPRLSLYARPTGSRFFEDVLPPPGWEWSEKKWALDLWSREWVEDRIITGVEVETEGERWVYDIYSDQEQQQQAQAAAQAATDAGLAFGDSDFDANDSVLRPVGAAAAAASASAFRPQIGPIWEEGEEGMGRRGEWRRRRWVRTVKRKKITASS